MGIEILRSQDCLQHRFRQEALVLTASSVRSRRNTNPNPNPNSNSCASQNRRRKRSPVAVQANQHDRDRRRHCDRSMVEKAPATNLVMGQVKILKRGEKLSSENSRAALDENPTVRAKSEECLDLVLGSTDRLGPNPETVQKEVMVWDSRDGIYAGSAFVASPPPSSVPVPVFLGKNGAATTDLRRLLRLEWFGMIRSARRWFGNYLDFFVRFISDDWFRETWWVLYFLSTPDGCLFAW